ncbi:hypothetical protein GF312_12285 [Candidatus Poribacteria bacterium]|nr:hypothetical protein [Candidatus Poribacteria bacterium]
MKKFLITLLLLAVTIKSAYTNNQSNELLKSLAQFGFENIRLYEQDDITIIDYENRIYIREKDAVKTIISKTKDFYPDIDRLYLISRKNDTPILSFSVKIGTEGEYDIEYAAVKHQNIKKYNSSSGKIDIIIRPEFDSLLGRFSDPMIYQLAISPEISTSITKQLKTSLQLKLFLYDELSNKEQTLSLGRFCFYYLHHRNSSSLLNLSGGYFGNNRYGMFSEYNHLFVNNNLTLGIMAAWLGNIYYWSDKFYYTRLWKWTSLGKVQYKLPIWNMILTARLGRFLHLDNGFRFEVTRLFRHTCLTIFVAKTSEESIGGFNIKLIPYPRKHMKPDRIRVRLPSLLIMNYRYAESDAARVFSSTYGIDHFIQRHWLMDL